MNEFTYERKDLNERLETYEWDNVWFEQANIKNAARVLYIGDSISCGIRGIATELSNGKYLFDSVGTSKALDNPFLHRLITLCAEQEGEREVVLFNNGLHGFHLSNEEYTEYYRKSVEFLVKNFSGSKIMIVLTTFTKQEEARKAIVDARNEIAAKIAGDFNLPVIDLFTISRQNADLLSEDGIHWTDVGYRTLAGKILEDIDR